MRDDDDDDDDDDDVDDDGDDDEDDDDDNDDGNDVDDNHRSLTFAMKCLPADRKDLGLDYLLSLFLTLVITENIAFCICVLISWGICKKTLLE